MARWEKLGTRGNVDDRRGRRGAAIAGGGGVIGIIAAIAFLLVSGGDDFGPVLDQISAQVQADAVEVDADEFEGLDDYELFASTVLGSTNEAWSSIFAASDLEYREPTLVLFRDSTSSGCGTASSAMGPHYCPRDETIYLDETFFDELQRRFGAQGGDVAEAYVIGHEVGHHVQTLIGINQQVRERQQGMSQADANELSVAMELQADCFAGVWASTLLDDGVFLPGELKEATDAAEAVGDDRIQEATQGRINPEAWTHGSSEQRKQWLDRGLDTGDPNACNTFG